MSVAEPSSLRPVTQDDLPKVLGIELRVHSAPWTEGNLAAELTKPYSNFLVLTDDETDEKVMGYIVFWVLFEECQIINVAVDLPFRGLGLAKKMVRQAVNQAVQKGIRKILLDVRKSNQAAFSLYQSLGFVVTHIRKDFYSLGSTREDAYQMALYLEDPTGVQF